MIERRKLVFYCEHCRKHGMSRHAMEKHERHCTLNPNRTCRWGGPDHVEIDLPAWIEMAKEMERYALLVRQPRSEELQRLRDVTDGCPACMLAALRQSGIDIQTARDNGWDYTKECERFREDEREAWRQEDRREIESSWL